MLATRPHPRSPPSRARKNSKTDTAPSRKGAFRKLIAIASALPRAIMKSSGNKLFVEVNDKRGPAVFSAARNEVAGEIMKELQKDPELVKAFDMAFEGKAKSADQWLGAIASLEKWAEGAFASENIGFLKDLQRLPVNASLNKVKGLFNKWIANGCEARNPCKTQVNLGDKIKSDIKNHLQQNGIVVNEPKYEPPKW